MTQLSPLSHALQDHYKKDATEIKLSSNMESEILLNSLVLNGLQLGSAEIPCLIRFLSGKEVGALSTLGQLNYAVESQMNCVAMFLLV